MACSWVCVLSYGLVNIIKIRILSSNTSCKYKGTSLSIDARMWLNHVATVTWNGQRAEYKLGFCLCQLLAVTFSSKTWHIPGERWAQFQFFWDWFVSALVICFFLLKLWTFSFSLNQTHHFNTSFLSVQTVLRKKGFWLVLHILQLG